LCVPERAPSFVWWKSCGCGNPQSSPSVRLLRLVPLLPRSVGFLPTFSPQGGLWPWPRPSPATPSQALARRHSPPGPVPIRPRRRPPPSTLGSSGGRHYGSRSQWQPGHPTGSHCGGRRRWHPWLCEHRRGGDGAPKNAVGAVGARARCASTTRLARWQALRGTCGHAWDDRAGASPLPAAITAHAG